MLGQRTSQHWNSLKRETIAADDYGARGTVKSADFEIEFGNNLASEPANWILKLRLDQELVT